MHCSDIVALLFNVMFIFMLITNATESSFPTFRAMRYGGVSETMQQKSNQNAIPKQEQIKPQQTPIDVQEQAIHIGTDFSSFGDFDLR
jgi:hypothetical protein